MKRLLAIIMSALLLLSSCAKAQSEPEPEQTENVMAGLFTASGSEASETTSPPVSEAAVITSETTALTYDDVQAAYPEKTVLTWAVYPFFGLAESVRVTEVNAYLDSLGKDYAVFFTPAFADGVQYWRTSLEEWGENIDLISGASLDNMIFYEFFSDISNYILNTDIGQELYSLMPENYWKACGDGDRIFAVGNPLDIVGLDYIFDYNEEIALKYNYDTEKSPLEQLDILEEIKSNENLAFVLPQHFESIVNFTNVRNLELPLYWDSEANEIKCIFDNREYLDRIRTVCELRAGGFETTGENIFAKVSREVLPDEDIEGYIRDIQTDGVTLKGLWYCSGVTPISQTPDKAFDLLATVFTDPYLNNLLTYGIEGEDYNIVDGRADNTYNIWGEPAFANSLICLPSTSQPKDLPERLRNGIENAEPDDALAFRIDKRGFHDKLLEIANYVSDFSDEVTGDNFDETVQKYREKLFDAGLQEIIDDVNRQYAEWSGKQ